MLPASITSWWGAKNKPCRSSSCQVRRSSLNSKPSSMQATTCHQKWPNRVAAASCVVTFLQFARGLTTTRWTWCWRMTRVRWAMLACSWWKAKSSSLTTRSRLHETWLSRTSMLSPSPRKFLFIDRAVRELGTSVEVTRTESISWKLGPTGTRWWWDTNLRKWETQWARSCPIAMNRWLKKISRRRCLRS